MKNKNIFLLCLCFLYYSCQEKANNVKENIVTQSNRYEDSTLSFVMKKFGLPQLQSDRSDSNTLVFYCLRSFDSSFLIHLRQEPNGINGAYYVEMPSYYNVNDSGAKENQLLFFEGYSFTLDSAKWQIVKDKAEELLRDTIFKNSPGCRDCKEYGLSYDLKSKIDNGIKYEPFYRFLKEQFLEKFIQKRKPFVRREK
ncbi:MAG TPA: hypothetical protein VET23_04270 [Chitinophagaceae bacterium]|nr:hypothetical protein [Chitinophagaceae bacterium]